MKFICGPTLCHADQTTEGSLHMATVFGISGLRSKLDEWRASRKISEADDSKIALPVATAFNLEFADNDEQDLSLLLENLVIPRLIADQVSDLQWPHTIPARLSAGSRPSQLISAADVDRFTQLSLECDARELLDFVDHCLEAGSSVETIYVDLLAPAARKLGEYWEEDSQDFVAVTMALWRIQEILRELTLRIPPTSQPGYGQRAALFSAMPGEQHSFGTLMISECFQRAGWDTDVLIEPTQSQLTAKFAKRHYDLIGLTVTNDCSTGALCNVVNSIKAVSANPHIRIMIGGRVVNERPELVVECGADATASDANAAVELANHLVPVRSECFKPLI